MGVSTDGILFYGIPYGEDLDMEKIAAYHGVDTEDMYFPRIYAAKMGVPEPAAGYSSELKPLFVEYWRNRDIVNKEGGCDIGTYCSDQCPMYYVYVMDGRYVVNRGHETPIPNGLTAKPEWREQIQRYCEIMGLPFKEPQWWLVSYWG